MKTKTADIRKKSIQRHHCQDCPAICCTDFALIVPRPRTKHDIEEYQWYLHYDTVSLCIRHGRWYLVVKGRCIYLDEHNMCKIYDRRPKRCRVHQPPECERYGCWYDVIFHTPEEMAAYLDKKRRARKRKIKNKR